MAAQRKLRSTDAFDIVIMNRGFLTINESLVVDRHGKNASNETEVFQMVLIAETRFWVHLEGVVIAEGGGGRRA